MKSNENGSDRSIWYSASDSSMLEFVRYTNFVIIIIIIIQRYEQPAVLKLFSVSLLQMKSLGLLAKEHSAK